MNIQMGYWQWRDISNGVLGARSLDKLHVSEAFVGLGFCVLLWIVAGREIITLDFAYLRIRKEVLGVGWSKKYALTDVRTIGVSNFLYPKSAGKWNPAAVRTEFYFDYAGKVKNFGSHLRSEDAVRIEKVIRSFPRTTPNCYQRADRP